MYTVLLVYFRFQSNFIQAFYRMETMLQGNELSDDGSSSRSEDERTRMVWRRVQMKRNRIDLKKKKAILDHIERNPTMKQGEVAKMFGVKREVIYHTIKEKNKLTNAHSMKAKKICKTSNPQIEKALLLWIKDVRSRNLPLSGPILQEKALQFGATFKVEGFRASEG